MKQKDDFTNALEDIFNLAREINNMAPAGPRPVDWDKLSQPDLAHMLKSFLGDVEKHLPKIREILMRLTRSNLSIVRRQLAKNGDKYEKVITVLDAIARTKFG